MLGQIPFVGYTVAELAPLAELEPTLDAGFVAGGTEEPEWFIAAASAQQFELDGFTVVQLPMGEVLLGNAVRQLRDQLRSSRHAERSAVEHLARLEAQLSQVTACQTEQRNSSDMFRQLDALKEELRRKEKWIASVEARASAADMRADEADVQVERLQQQLSLATHAEGRIAELENKLATLTTSAVGAEQQLAGAHADVARLETLLADRGERIRELQADIATVTRVGEQLVRDLQKRNSGRAESFQSQSWGADLPVDNVQLLPTATVQSIGHGSNWADQAGSDREVVTQDAPASHMHALSRERAKLSADIHAARWRVNQLRALAQESVVDVARAGELRALLQLAEERIQEQEVLLDQLRTQPGSS